MMRYYYLLFFLWTGLALGQTDQLITVAAQDTIVLDSSGINPIRFKVMQNNGTILDTSAYRVDFAKGLLILNTDSLQETDSLKVNYVPYPDYLTKRYYVLDPKIIASNNSGINRLQTLEQSNTGRTTTPFEGLNTLGSISRGITVGSNQNTVVNSELDLQITGQLNDKVAIRASIQDANIPTQEGGYSQSLDEFDQIFIELYGDKWRIRAGDVDLINDRTYFGRFTKKVQGIALGATFDHKDGSRTEAIMSGALVRGVFQRSTFNALEGNQGPYKLVGPNGELYILIVSGSERVFVNGLLLKRGENNDYVIDYNAGEIRFNPTFPITANMRIVVEYQFTDRNYSRFIGYGAGNYTNQTFGFGAYVYTESDAKNQPLQQNLTEDQVEILVNAGDDPDQMIAPSAIPDTFSENKILYKKELLDGVEIFVFSNNPEDELFNVRFSLVGDNNGDYVLSSNTAVNTIYEYVAPINGVPQGNYAPIVRLNAPEKLQMAGFDGYYRPSEKTDLNFELAGSINDLNLFSDIDNDDNEGIALRFEGKQRLVTTTDSLQLDVIGSADYLNKDFRNIERLYNVEFTRDWNLLEPMGDQRYLTAGLSLGNQKGERLIYQFQNLDFSENFSGFRHQMGINWRLGRWGILASGSLMDSESDTQQTSFSRANTHITYSLDRAWIGGKYWAEDNQLRTTDNDSLSCISQRFSHYEVYTGIGDSTKVYGTVGYRYRVNDSVRSNRLKRVNTSHDIYLKSNLVQNQNTQLNLFANYRELLFEADSIENEKTLNARLVYGQRIWKGAVRLNTVIESNTGTVAQQEFTYIQTEPGQGIYTWIDYNENGVQELDEFEVAQFPDEAEYIRVLLPNQLFVKVRNNKFSQLVTLNPANWANRTGLKKFLSHFHNQTSYLIDRKVRKGSDLGPISPFGGSEEEELGLALNFRNTLFFNRGKQRYTTSYTYISSATSNLIAFGLQENKLYSHQLNFSHKVQESWIMALKGSIGNNKSTSQNFSSRNFDLDTYDIEPKVSYLLNQRTRFDLSYQRANKANQLMEFEELTQNQIGFSFAYNNVQQISISGGLSYIENQFEGSPFSPVAYTMLEGLQPGTNFTWNLLFQKRITKFLDANLSYFGRKSENTNAIHTGTIQLRAYF